MSRRYSEDFSSMLRRLWKVRNLHDAGLMVLPTRHGKSREHSADFDHTIEVTARCIIVAKHICLILLIRDYIINSLVIILQFWLYKSCSRKAILSNNNLQPYNECTPDLFY